MDLSDQCREVRVVVYGIIGELCLLVHRNLRIFANFKLLLIHEPPLPGPFHPVSAIRVDENEPVATVCPSNFDQQGHIEYNRSDVRTLVVLPNQFFGSFEDERMEHIIQGRQTTRLAKDNLRELPAVDIAGSV